MKGHAVQATTKLHLSLSLKELDFKQLMATEFDVPYESIEDFNIRPTNQAGDGFAIELLGTVKKES